MTKGFVPGHVRWRYRNPNVIAHELRRAMTIGLSVRIEERNGAGSTARVIRMTRDESINVAHLPEQNSNLTAWLDDGRRVKVDAIKTVEPV